MARSDGTSVQPDDTWQLVIKQLIFVSAWIKKHMDSNCVEDAIGAEEGRPALHFMSTEVIEGRHFCLQLEKEPVGNVVKEFKATWLPHLDAEIRELGVHSSNVMNVGEGGVMWPGNPEPITLVLADRKYICALLAGRPHVRVLDFPNVGAWSNLESMSFKPHCSNK